MLFSYNIYNVYYGTMSNFVNYDTNTNTFDKENMENFINIVEKHNNRIDEASKRDTYDNVMELYNKYNSDVNDLEEKKHINIENFHDKMGNFLEKSINESYQDNVLEKINYSQQYRWFGHKSGTSGDSPNTHNVIINVTQIEDEDKYIVTFNNKCLKYVTGSFNNLTLVNFDQCKIEDTAFQFSVTK